MFPMSKKQIVLFATALLCTIFLTIGITFAVNKKEETATNVVTVGNVKIALVNEYAEPEDVKLLPGQEIDKRVAVKNIGSTAAYIRIKLKKKWETVAENGDTAEMTSGDLDYIKPNFCNPQLWVYNAAEGCYYYQKSLAAGATTEELMDSFQISTAMTNEEIISTYAKARGTILVSAEAVQAEHYNPLNEEGKIVAWEGVDFTQYVEDYVVETTPIPEGEYTDSTVTFVNDANDFIKFSDGDDLFLNMTGMLPGQTVKQTIQVKNTSSKAVKLYLYAKTPGAYNLNITDNSLTEAEKAEIIANGQRIMEELWSSLRLTIIDETDGAYVKNEDGIPINNINLFRVNNYEMSENNKILLGEFASKKAANFKISLTLDPEWEVGSCETKVDWVFLCNEAANYNPQVNITDIPATEEPKPTVTPEWTTPTATLEPTLPPSIADPTPNIVTPTPNIETPTKEPIVTQEPITPTITPTPDDGVVVETNPPAIETPQPTLVIEETKAPTQSGDIEETKKPNKTKKPSVPQATKKLETTKPTSVPKKQTPDTGDVAPLLPWTICFLLSGIGSVWLGIRTIKTR